MRDAKALLSSGSFQNAYMLAGMAIELALKARIMFDARMNAWPSRKQRPELYVHILGNLVATAGLKQLVEAEVALLTDVGLAWLVMKDFDIMTRYPLGKPFPVRVAADAVEAIDGLGLVKWLTTGIP